jgi:hypothetical protein
MQLDGSNDSGYNYWFAVQIDFCLVTLGEKLNESITINKETLREVQDR